MIRTWWQRPALIAGGAEGEERKVSWLELFFDLVFVVVVSELAHTLSTHVTAAGVGSFGLLFLPVWWAWIGATFYNDRFETLDVRSRVFTFLQMLAVAGMAISAHDGLGATSAGFALSYAAYRSLLVVLWWRAGYHNPAMKTAIRRLVTGFSASILLFTVSVFVPAPQRFALWALGLLIDLVTPTVVRGFGRLAVGSHDVGPKMVERLGLFTIIVLGETLIGVIQGVAGQDRVTPVSAVLGALGMALAFLVWWLYFDFVARYRVRPGPWASLAWIYLHLPLVVGIAALGAVMPNVIGLAGSPVAAGPRWLLVGSVAITLVAIAFLGTVLQRSSLEVGARQLDFVLVFGSGALALSLGVWGARLGAPALLGTLLVLLLINVVRGVVLWAQSLAAAPPGATMHEPLA